MSQEYICQGLWNDQVRMLLVEKARTFSPFEIAEEIIALSRPTPEATALVRSQYIAYWGEAHEIPKPWPIVAEALVNAPPLVSKSPNQDKKWGSREKNIVDTIAAAIPFRYLFDTMRNMGEHPTQFWPYAIQRSVAALEKKTDGQLPHAFEDQRDASHIIGKLQDLPGVDQALRDRIVKQQHRLERI
jgi:hypothetical protein